MAEKYSLTFTKVNDEDIDWSRDIRRQANFKKGFDAAVKELNSLIDRMLSAERALLHLEAGFAGMFGHQEVSPWEDAVDRGSDMINDHFNKYPQGKVDFYDLRSEEQVPGELGDENE